MVDEKTTAAAGVPAKGAELRATTVGSDARRRRMRDDTKSARRPPQGYQVSPLFRLGQTGIIYMHCYK